MLHSQRSPWWVSAVAVPVTFVVIYKLYVWSPGHIQLADSAYSLLVSEQILKHGTMQLNSAMPADPQARRQMPGAVTSHGLPYQFVDLGGRPAPDGRPGLYYGYPLGSSLLSLPLVAGLNARGVSALGADGTYFVVGEVELQRRVSAAVAAATAWALLLMARMMLPWLPSVGVTLAFAFASPLWSTLARALWGQTWEVLCIAAVVALLVRLDRAEARRGWAALGYGLAVGSALFWAAFCRPQSALSAIVVGVYLIAFQRRVLAVTVVTGLGWVATLVLFSRHFFGQTLPPSVYSAGEFEVAELAARAWGLLVTPSRGLLIYCPALLILGYLLVAYRRLVADRRLLWVSLVGVALHFTMLVCYRGWRGGASYGPRYFADALPWFALLSLLAVRAWLDRPEPVRTWRRATEAGLLAAALAWGVFVHGRGATVQATWEWNIRMEHPELGDAVYDWRAPQFLAGLSHRVLPDGHVEKVPRAERWAALTRVGR